MSMWADYLKEREGKETIETNEGFIVYKLFPSECYIVDIYVAPAHRRSRAASTLADQVAAIAKEKGCTLLTGSVNPSLESATVSIKTLLGYGMKLHRADQSALIFYKEI